MTRNLRALGLAFVAVFAISAIGAAGAQASHFAWESGATTLQTEADPDDPSTVITTTASNLTCNEVSASIALPGGTTAETLTTNNLKYDNNKTGKCIGTGGLEPKLEMNGCNYRLHAGETVTGGIEVTKDLTCPVGSPGIKFNAGFLCTVTIPPQSGLTGATATNVKTVSKEEITLETTSENVSYSHTGLCGNGSAKNGIIHGKATIKAITNPVGLQMHATVT